MTQTPIVFFHAPVFEPVPFPITDYQLSLPKVRILFDIVHSFLQECINIF